MLVGAGGCERGVRIGERDDGEQRTDSQSVRGGECDGDGGAGAEQHGPVGVAVRGEQRRDDGGLLRERDAGERAVRERERVGLDGGADGEPVHGGNGDFGDGERDVLHLGLPRAERGRVGVMRVGDAAHQWGVRGGERSGGQRCALNQPVRRGDGVGGERRGPLELDLQRDQRRERRQLRGADRRRRNPAPAQLLRIG